MILKLSIKHVMSLFEHVCEYNIGFIHIFANVTLLLLFATKLKWNNISVVPKMLLNK